MRRTWPTVTCIVGMAVSGAVLILQVPSLFTSEGTEGLWIAVVSGGLALAFAGGAWYWKPLSPVASADK